MSQATPRLIFHRLLDDNRPRATAWVTGNDGHPQLSGLVKFYDTPYGGTLVEAEVFGLPADTSYASGFFGLHIHEYGDCSRPFDKTGEHYNPTLQPHPQHAGDLLPLFSNQGYAWGAFYDKRITPAEIIGRSVVIHSRPDDFTSQPSGNSGDKIGCGVIRLTQA